MKVHYINILLFADALNILVNTHKNNTFSTHHTPKIPSIRLLCECELYAPVNYDSDPEMKKVMQQFEDRTTQRLRDYDNRMKTARQKCKEQCDKEIQKIILKDKLEKELMDKFATLQTDIQNDAIPTCICEKSLADKTEKFCLNCGKTMGGFAPGYCLVSGLWYAAWTHYVAGIAAKAATEAGISKAVEGLGKIYALSEFSYMDWIPKVTATNFDKPMELVDIVNGVSNMCVDSNGAMESAFCYMEQGLRHKPGLFVKTISQEAAKVAAEAGNAAKSAEVAEAAKYTWTTSTLTTGITASVIAIVVIVLIMMIIYWILRYRRKKKMMKKLQYIKLLEE
ncbi:rifin PIR protein,putative [Plasmodium sp. DRC-Itaito]|nr:rifin PIR protein,putative [Plasmodium sp. DRC-Itaito]